MDDRHGRHRRTAADGRRGPASGFHVADRDRFRRLAEEAIASLPTDLRETLAQVTLVIDDVPPAGAGTALGRYLGERMVLYRRAIELRARSREELVEIIRRVVAREVARHRGEDVADGEDQG